MCETVRRGSQRSQLHRGYDTATIPQQFKYFTVLHWKSAHTSISPNTSCYRFKIQSVALLYKRQGNNTSAE